MRCCKQTQAGRVLEEGICIFGVTCSSFCLKTDDCLPPARCDTSRFNCTTKCSNDTDCHLGYICENDHCVSNETKHNDISESVTFLGLLPLLPFVLCPGLCFCYCFLALVYYRLQICFEKLQSLYLRHRGRNCTVGSLNENPPTSINAEMLETDSIRPPVYDSNSESFDTNLSSNRPACIEVSDVPEVPPPPYESIITLVVFPNELQNGETLETDSTRPPVLETNGESFDNIASRGLPSFWL